ncbi:uncharacterized protein LOC6573416 [Drosophila mojavensis]|uniref:DUF4776 domain-containing protein n=1 Tax=Drosophila mojavensis TaxID=7230 RepID=B4KDW1_DROMO|nr:uncharacterized protein LOC6573416 [Drosophila mojavensis]EDW14958.2 uncharacterized protein Dmoj_GI24549 [Drosophila mojavensis]
MDTAACTYMLDVIVTYLKTTEIKIEDPKKLQVDVCFDNKPLQITSSRINVKDFKGESSFEFSSNAEILRQNVAAYGMPVIVKYNGKVIGLGNIGFPPVFIDRIDANMNDILCASSCRFQLAGKVAGTLEVLCRLYMKCTDTSRPREPDCSQTAKNSIHPQDIMFLMGDVLHCPKASDICPDILPPDDNKLRFELESYQSAGPKTDPLRPLEPLLNKPVTSGATCGIKTLGRRPERFTDIVARGGNEFHPFKLSARKSIGRSSNAVSFLSDSRSTPNIHYSVNDPVSAVSNNNLYGPRLVPMEVDVEVDVEDMQNADIKGTRFCPICLTNMSWLPKFAACVKCGAKPVPVIEERHKEKTPTADEILKDLLGKPPKTIEDYCSKPPATVVVEEKDLKPACRCTCQNGRTCAHCRIRKLCADIFHEDEKPVACLDVKEHTIEDIYMENKTIEKCGPHLTRVFSELRDLYDINATKLSEELKDKCDPVACKPKDNNLNASAKPKLKTKPLVKVEKTVSTTALQKRLPVKIGHKFCTQLPGNVPPNHGWAWIKSDETRKYGWQPGFVRKSIKRIMKFFLQYLPERNAFNRCLSVAKKQNENEHNLPTLRVYKKSGEIFITLRAANNTEAEVKPIVFKIVKSDLAAALSDIKKKLKAKGYRKCTCHNTLMMCVCRSVCEKKKLEGALQKECTRRGIESCANHLVLTDTSDSEMEFDINVTAPTPEANLKPPTVNNATQVKNVSLCIPPRYPLKQNPYRRVYDCATSGRYTGTVFGRPAAVVLEDGVFGQMGGGLYKGNTTPGSTSSGSLQCDYKTNEYMGRAQPPERKLIKSMFVPAFKGRLLNDGRLTGGMAVQLIPGLNKQPANGECDSKCMPKAVPKRLAMKTENNVNSQTADKENEIAKRKLNRDMHYLKKSGSFTKPKPLLSQDGLTDLQKRQRVFLQISSPPIELANRKDIERQNTRTTKCLCTSFNNF